MAHINAMRSRMAFPKGRSPNPDGRRLEAAVRRTARAEAEKCIAALARVRDDDCAAPEVRLAASAKILALGGYPKALPASGV